MNESQGPAQAAGEEPLILVVDQDAGQREFIRRVLRESGFNAEAVASGEEALAAARLKRPELALLEVPLGEISGYEVCRTFRERFDEDIAIMFVSSHRTDPADRVAGLLLGADDYAEKPLHKDELLARVRGLLRRLGARRRRNAEMARGDLTPREFEVLELLADGANQDGIAKQLFITPRTVAKHIEHILAKLPAHNRAEAVSIAWQRRVRSAAYESP